MSIKPIPINRDIPYADNLANAINEYWKMTVAIPDGSRSAFEGNVYTNSMNGIPVKVAANKRMHHPAVVRVRRGLNNKWFIVGEDK